MNIDLKKIRALLRTLADSDVTEFEYEEGKTRVRLTRGQAPHVVSAAQLLPALPAAAPTPTESTRETVVDVSDQLTITSPFVGTFYRAASPDSPPFVEIGGTVREGQTLCIVEAMKLMNEIEADCTGTIVDVLVDNGKSVEFGQALFRIAPL